jgi:hypothetical protein
MFAGGENARVHGRAKPVVVQSFPHKCIVFGIKLIIALSSYHSSL